MFSLILSVILVIFSLILFKKHKQKIKFEKIKITEFDCLNSEMLFLLTDVYFRKSNKPEYIYLYFYKGCLVGTEEFYDVKNVSFVKSKINSFLFKPLLEHDDKEIEYITSKQKDVAQFIKRIIRNHKKDLEDIGQVNKMYTQSILSKVLSEKAFKKVKAYAV